jgi:hypothetical protein
MRTEQAPRLPNDGGRTPNDFGALLIDSDTGHKLTPLPIDWAGRRILLQCVTNPVTVAGTIRVTADAPAPEVDRAAAAGSPGTSDKVGITLTPGVLYEFQLPAWGAGQTFSLVHEASVDNTVLFAMLGN